MTEQLQLQPRLRLLADLVPQGARLADIGTDHGYLPVYLLQRGRIASAIAADIGRAPLDHARRTAEQYGVECGLRFLCCDGLCGISPEDADTVVIAGMGGETIIRILSQAPWTRSGETLLLLQPMTKQEPLRRWLNENGYAQCAERLVQDKDYLYPIFTVYGGPQPSLSVAEIYGGGPSGRGIPYPAYPPIGTGGAGTCEKQRRRKPPTGPGAGKNQASTYGEEGTAMITVRDVESFLYTWAPAGLAASWDNVGLLVGDPVREVKKILTTLDITESVVEEAVQIGADLIVSHHPVMNCAWHPVQTLRSDDRQGRILTGLVENRISAICMHTNLDAADGGVNDVLAEKLGLLDTQPLTEEKIGRVGTLKCELPLVDFTRFVVELLGCNGLRFTDCGKAVHRVAVGGGACGDYIAQAIALGCDTFVTSDLRYHDFLDTKELNLIDAGHFPTEQVIVPELCRRLQAAFSAVSVSTSISHKSEVIQYCI